MKWEKEVKGDNTRIDIYLAKRGLRLSRSRVKRLISDGKVRVNGLTVKPSYIVKDGDHITVDYEPFKPAEVIPENISIDIVYEDKDIIVINKEKGIVTHPAKGNLNGTLVNAVLYHTGNLPEGSSNERPGVIHRLDKNTTGLIVFAKNYNAHTILGRQINQRTVKRIYIALVWGKPPVRKGTIDAPIGRHLIHRQKMAVTPFSSRNAVTHYQVLYSFGYVSVLKLKLETGRTHQIRVHLSFLGYPVVGDPDYNGRNPQIIQKIGLANRKHFDNILNMIDRQALHAAELGFIHPTTGENVKFYAPLPEDIRRIMNYLLEGINR